MVDAVLGSVAPLVESVVAFCRDRGIDVFSIDHVCYRVESRAAYCHTLAALIPAFGTLAVQGMIAGRPIATVALYEPLHVSLADGSVVHIPAIELPCPKAGRPYPTGWEHCEVVIGPPEAEPVGHQPLVEFMQRHPHLDWNVEALHKDCNPDVSLRVNQSTTVKFHLVPLLNVIEWEAARGTVVPVPSDYFDDL